MNPLLGLLGLEELTTIRVTKELSADMKDIPRKFNETLTDWAIRCQILRRYNAPPGPQAPVGERP